MSKFKKQADMKPTDPIELSLLCIKNCIAEYNFVTKQIEAEMNFDLLKYWEKHLPAELKFRPYEASRKVGRESKRKVSRTSKGTDAAQMEKITCFGITSREHNVVGKGKPFSKRLYIKDQPANTKILIIILGNLSNTFYRNLLLHHQPLSAIIHFLPEECAYDLLVPRPRRDKHLRETIEQIQQDIHSLCKRNPTKPVGILQQQLPQMSTCLAAKFASEIFDQLSWYIYDVETLKEHYKEYYVKPYKTINVKMNPAADMQEKYLIAGALSIQGHYLKAEMPVAHNDDASIYLYVESLLSTFGKPRELMTEMEVLLLANPSPLVQTKVLDKIKVYANAFKSIIKLFKNERLFVEHTNKLLRCIVSYTDQHLMRNIYHGCLEYNIVRRYFNTGYILNTLQYAPYQGVVEPRYLPKYAKLYLTDDAVVQRITELVDEYDDYTIEEIYPAVKLFTFKRGLNEVFENEKQIVIPTRLCFRDFTLYEMEQFVKDLVTPQMFEEAIEQRTEGFSELLSVYQVGSNTDNHATPYRCREGKYPSVIPSMFIRPESLKARKLVDDKKESKMETLPASGSKTRMKTNNFGGNMRSAHTIHSDKLSEHLSVKELDYMGLGPNHPMLTGYNLDDTRQTIRTKLSKYYFEEGLLNLYEEKWNFRQMNKCLSFQINRQTIHFTHTPNNIHNVASNVRIETPHGISLRIKPTNDECCQAVLNYPNGQTLYCHDTHAELLWNGQENELNETRRINTPYGCVIVFYRNTDMVLIMRYNGEVYRLYSSPFEDGEEEEGVIEETSEFMNACSTQSTYSSYKPLPTVKTSKKKKRKINVPANSSRNTGGSDNLSKKKSDSSTSSRTLQARAARKKQEDQAAALFASINSELKFLKFIIDLFKIQYNFLHLTTSLGSVVLVEQTDKIKCSKPIRLTEWHDYCQNESYSMRDDGVRIIWGIDGMRCYHRDGTVINTTTVESINPGTTRVKDEIDHQISSSSSHKVFDQEDEGEGIIYINAPEGTPFDPTVEEPAILEQHFGSDVTPDKPTIDQFLFSEEAEEVEFIDMTFVAHLPSSFNMQHKIYPGTHFCVSYINEQELNVELKVTAADNLKFHIFSYHHDEEPQMHRSLLRRDSDISGERVSSEPDTDEWTQRKQGDQKLTQFPDCTAVEIQSCNLSMLVREVDVEIVAVMRKYGCDHNANVVCDLVTLKLESKQGLDDVFRKWVEDLNEFIHCACPKWRYAYFLESTAQDCRKKGFELFKKMPCLGQYSFCAGNYAIDAVELKSVNALMRNNFDWFEKDMLKFPRFRLPHKSPPPVQVPNVLSTKVYVEIPVQLANTDRIHLFIYPFDKIKFRKMKHRFTEAVLFHLHPRMRLLVQSEISKRSWRNHHLENQKLLFKEQQRLSLYIAMLKHKVYPNYFQFKDQFYSHVRNIDFVEFMASKCNEKVNPQHYQDPPRKSEMKNRVSEEPFSNKKRKRKCLCPKYLNSLL
ncbi:uncharacterized protein LOC108594463 [Drosophila busckii]|uniref:uncharacterized protein LOC108594463 n=1 Tax=Drosophila busckii TaxID=30019 RepID=UPI001432EB42|nr:uncharacterized protein LOC108594463 [Drosophila busckii]